MSTSRMNLYSLYTQSPAQFPPFPIIRLHGNGIIRGPTAIRITLCHHNCRKSTFQIVRSSIRDGQLLDAEHAAVLVSTCITRNLPPALTLEHGLDKIEEALEQLKLNPPCSTFGMHRFQVAVPPSTKALNWFCCQPESSGVFPHFFFSKEMDCLGGKLFRLNKARGIFGIGAAVDFWGNPSRISAEGGTFQRCFSDDSICGMAYGFMGTNFNKMSSSKKQEIDSFYCFIPQIQLDELEGISILAATLAWNNSSLHTFEAAVQKYELALHQVRYHFWPTSGDCCKKSIHSSLRQFKTVDDKMVCMSSIFPGRRSLEADSLELKDASSSQLFFARLSPELALSNNMLSHSHEMNISLHDCANINTLWASLIVEECCRLGLTYFCVAPGSRSSPLAIAVSAHPLAACIVCFDERSLAFHALGYARGSHKPAVVITTSGTAVSNLLPAVVEASQDFVPLLVLTADRPPELQDSGANQTINQVNHFGSFMRSFFNLPVPTDNISVRMVLTTLDSAIYVATYPPYGPVHINCPFREPLENSPKKWDPSCLKGLDFWMSSAQPFTSYIKSQHSFTCSDTHGQMGEIMKMIEQANHGLLLIGAMHTVDDIWAALLLAKHLSWPVVVDILSGLRLRKYLTSFQEIEENFFFVDHLDHLLISNSVRDWFQADVIVQIGSRITSKRISQMLESCIPYSYIMVDKHPSRHDPSHIVTHRVHGTITEFADCVLKACEQPRVSKWKKILYTLNIMVAWEISFLIGSEYLLTEPYVVHAIPQVVRHDSVIFVGNSMPIRDADMYGCSWTKFTHRNTTLLSSGIPFNWIQVAGNRGASGIDGLLSTVTGFAVGCNKRVVSVIGDVSFLHDTNGLALLKQRKWRKPMTILVINNHGGAIFSLLPIADRTDQKVLDQFFYASHNVSIRNLCLAHSVEHVIVHTKTDLLNALFKSQNEETDYIIEIENSIDANASFHRSLRNFTCQAADQAFSILSRISIFDSISHGHKFCKIFKMEYSLYRVRLCAPPTSISVSYKPSTYYREGFIIALSLEDGSIGFGEVAPLEIHKENLFDVEEQLKFLIHVTQGANIGYCLPLLRGSFSSWIWNTLGILPSSIFPSVRCGLEMAVLNAIAAREGFNLLDLLHPQTNKEKICGKPLSVQMCALVDSNGTPGDIAYLATKLVKEGFAAIKLKVARRPNPTDDGAVIQEVRKKVGQQIELRADANRRWTYKEAIQFGSAVKNCRLQYIEEPVRDEGDIIKFSEETGLPVALDETIDTIKENPLEVLAKFAHSGVVAIVIKPSIIGGFENAALIARWALQLGKMTIVSSAFESGVSLSSYILFSCYLELENANICRVMNKKPAPPVAQGLGTYQWLEEDVAAEPLNICRNPYSGYVEASAVDAGKFLKKFQLDCSAILQTFSGEQILKYQVTVVSMGVSFLINVQEIRSSMQSDRILVLLHGFLGSGEDWIPIMKAVSGSTRCVAIDLPGHGGSKLHRQSSKNKTSLSIGVIADILCKLFHNLTPGKVFVVGYSMGARIALYMALKCSDKIEGAVIISGSPGLKDEEAKKLRRAKDDFRASSLISHGLEFFVETWYAGDLWNSLRVHPHFKQIVANRLQNSDVHGLAKALSDLSVGRQMSLWEDLKRCKVPLLLIVGERDAKFRRIAIEMCHEFSHHTTAAKHQDTPAMVEIPNCGHAAHLENPLAVISAISKFLREVKKS